jgi:hypothetical protein
MAEKSIYLTDDGQELQQQDVNLAGATAGLADDRALAEALRVAPFDGTNVYKAVIPYTTTAGSHSHPATAPVVAPTGSANGSILINPFRAVIGSRNSQGTAPTPNPTSDVASLAAWRDVRSAVFTGSSTTLAQTFALAANASGNPRWDLVYAQVSVDVGQNTVVRRVKDPSSGAISTPSIPQYNGSPVVVAIVTGTPGASPALPVLPADAAGNYCIPLAWVRVPNGFSSGSTVAAGDIRACTLGHDGATPISDYRDISSGARMRPATGNNDTSGTYATRGFPWAAATAGARPGPFMSPDWVGGDEIMVEIDMTAGSSSGWSHNSGDVVDDSVDWRNRIFPLVICQGGTTKFANDTSGATTSRLPTMGPIAGDALNIQMANSCGLDAQVVAGASTISYNTSTTNPAVAGGAVVALYVDPSSGAMKAYISGAPACRLVFFLKASAPYPNL